MSKKHTAKILLLDVETSPIVAHVWGTREQNIGSNQIIKDWTILAWAAQWRGEKKMMYMDQRNHPSFKSEKRILKGMWKLLDEADVIVTQNGIRFDEKKLNARFLVHKLGKPSSYKHIDTVRIARQNFGFTSNSLADLCEQLGLENKKSQHKKFPGMTLWNECLLGNKEAWKEMEHYNKRDVLALSSLYDILAPWNNSVNFSLYEPGYATICSCGGNDYHKNGYCYTSVGKYQRYKCSDCGSEVKGGMNLIPKPQAKELLRKVTK